jgi:hypothetical protein
MESLIGSSVDLKELSDAEDTIYFTNSLDLRHDMPYNLGYKTPFVSRPPGARSNDSS